MGRHKRPKRPNCLGGTRRWVPPWTGRKSARADWLPAPVLREKITRRGWRTWETIGRRKTRRWAPLASDRYTQSDTGAWVRRKAGDRAKGKAA